MSPYHYTECGLDHVMINGVQFIQDDAGESVTTIPNIDGLHRAIATGIVSKSGNLTGKELRFLRTEMGMTQAELAAIVHREPLAISRWERGETELIDANAETLIRLFAKEKLNLEIDVTVPLPVSDTVTVPLSDTALQPPGRLLTEAVHKAPNG